MDIQNREDTPGTDVSGTGYALGDSIFRMTKILLPRKTEYQHVIKGLLAVA